MKCDCLPVEFDIMADDDGWSPEIIAIVKKYALQNAVEYNGSGKSGSVLGRILGERTDLRSKAKELKKLGVDVDEKTLKTRGNLMEEQVNPQYESLEGTISRMKR